MDVCSFAWGLSAPWGGSAQLGEHQREPSEADAAPLRVPPALVLLCGCQAGWAHTRAGEPGLARALAPSPQSPRWLLCRGGALRQDPATSPSPSPGFQRQPEGHRALAAFGLSHAEWGRWPGQRPGKGSRDVLVAAAPRGRGAESSWLSASLCGSTPHSPATFITQRAATCPAQTLAASGGHGAVPAEASELLSLCSSCLSGKSL